MVPKALCDGEKKSKMGGVFQGESIYESNLKHDRPRADFKNRNSKEEELIRNMVIGGIFPSWSMPSKKGSKLSWGKQRQFHFF